MTKYKNSYYWFLWTGLLAYLVSLNLPLLSITKVYVFKDEISLISILVTLWQEQEVLLYLIIFGFVVFVPVCKFLLLILSGANPSIITSYQRTYHLLSIVGKWAMLDVFIAAIIIVVIKLGVMTQAHTQIGLYLFVYSIMASMICTQLQKYKE